MGLLSRAEGSTASKPVLTNTDASKKKPGSPEEIIVQYHRQFGKFHCIVFKNPGPAEKKADFCQQLTKMINGMGTILPLNLEHQLILLPFEKDRELITHRLSKSLNTQAILSFETDNPANVLNRIKTLS